jgi:hypothetical protein
MKCPRCQQDATSDADFCPEWARHCHLGLGKVYRHTGKRDQAREHLTSSTTMYRDMGMTFWLEKAVAEIRESV